MTGLCTVLSTALGEGEWQGGKHGADERRVWHKVHLVRDASSHQVRGEETTDHLTGEGEFVPGLLAQLPLREADRDDRQRWRLGETQGGYEASAARDVGRPEVGRLPHRAA